jgi:hypothetical protein
LPPQQDLYSESEPNRIAQGGGDFEKYGGKYIIFLSPIKFLNLKFFCDMIICDHDHDRTIRFSTITKKEFMKGFF